MARERTTFSSDFRRFFVRGLGVLLPSVLTLWIVWQGYLFLDRQVAEPINRGIRSGILWVMPQVSEKRLPTWFVVSGEEVTQYKKSLEGSGSLESRAMLQRSDAEIRDAIRTNEFKRYWDAHWYFRFIGLIVAVILIYLAGRTLGGIIGRKIYRQFEMFMTRIPVFKQVYPHVKQVVDMIFGEKQMAFKRVVLVEYPRKGVWSLGFVTSEGMKAVREAAGESAVTVFIPSTPTPFTGFTITVPLSQVADMPISIDEAVRFLITGGVLIPSKQLVPAADAGADPITGGSGDGSGNGRE